jgi:hypothetical protein
MILPPAATFCGECEERVEESIVENGYPEKTIQPAEEETQQPQSANPATAVEVISEPEEKTSLHNESDDADSSSKDEQDTDNQHSSARTDTEHISGTQAMVEDGEYNVQTTNDNTAVSGASSEPTPLAVRISGTQAMVEDAKQDEQKTNDNTAVSGGSNASTPLAEEAPQDSSATEVSPAIEKTSASGSNTLSLGLSRLLSQISQQEKRELTTPTKTLSSLLKHVKRFILSSQPRINNVVAIIETPMRIQPNTNYTIRIHLIGRDEPKHVPGLKENNDMTRPGGLGSLIHGERVHIEVRSALYHNYAYIVQQADVEVPASNYAAEITIPMRSITGSPGTRRELLHIFFTDEKQNPLYEKPFLIELFISSLVQSGHEGHNILSIPL